MKQQTAVEWLWNVLADKGYFKKLPISEIKQAKQMEKEQIKLAVDYGCSDWGSAKDAELYYNENFNLGTEETER